MSKSIQRRKNTKYMSSKQSDWKSENAIKIMSKNILKGLYLQWGKYPLYIGTARWKLIRSLHISEDTRQKKYVLYQEVKDVEYKLVSTRQADIKVISVSWRCCCRHVLDSVKNWNVKQDINENRIRQSAFRCFFYVRFTRQVQLNKHLGEWHGVW